MAASFAAPAVLATVLARTGSQHVLVPLIAVGTVALLGRRRAPMLVLTALTVLAVVTTVLTHSLNGFDLGVSFAIYAVAAMRAPRAAWVALAAATVVVDTGLVVWAPATRVGEITGYAVATFAAMAIGISVRNRRLHVTELVERGNALARETEQRAQLATAEERARIAREMHDVVAHSLSVMIALADGAAAALDRSPASARTAITEVSATGRAALADVRRVLGVLRDDEASFGPPPGGTDLEALAQSFRAAGLPVDLSMSGAPLPPDTGLQLAVYRIVQESLTNALRHTRGAGRVVARIVHVTGTVSIEVTDDGGLSHTVRVPGFGAPTAGTSATGTAGAAPASATTAGSPAPGGRGIIGMRERAAIYGGTVAAGPRGAGWRVDAALHWDEETS